MYNEVFTVRYCKEPGFSYRVAACRLVSVGLTKSLCNQICEVVLANIKSLHLVSIPRILNELMLDPIHRREVTVEALLRHIKAFGYLFDHTGQATVSSCFMKRPHHPLIPRNVLRQFEARLVSVAAQAKTSLICHHLLEIFHCLGSRRGCRIPRSHRS